VQVLEIFPVPVPVFVEHPVQPNRSQEDRISMVFNIDRPR